jgi:gamma-glutamylcyclotransferase (GGCT)/AIG2-like uncharacterized protein YtfP
MKMLPAFVYGTLRNGGGNYQWILDGNTVSEQGATFAGGRMFDTGGFPYVIATQNPGETIVGELMHVVETRYVDVLRMLDGLEGFRGEGSPRNHYDRRIVTVTTADGTEHEAYIYLVPEARINGVLGLPEVTSGDWMAHVGRAPAAL